MGCFAIRAPGDFRRATSSTVDPSKQPFCKSQSECATPGGLWPSWATTSLMRWDGPSRMARVASSAAHRKERPSASRISQADWEGLLLISRLSCGLKSLPVRLDLPGLRVIHACWNSAAQETLAGCLDPGHRFTQQGFRAANQRGTPAYQVAEVLL